MLEALSKSIEKGLAELGLPQDLPGLYDPIEYTLSLGGKRIRPILTVIAAGIHNHRPLDAINQALAIEIFHNFTLVHDDIMDEAPLRRGKPSVYRKWDTNTAILSGDVMFSLAYRALLKCPDDVLPSVSRAFTEASIKVCEGQQMDMDFETSEEVSLDDYMQMISLKTAYLLAASLQIGGIMGGADSNTSKALFDYGMAVGTAFQLQDDYLDAYGDPEKFGKQVGGDILAGKKTYLYLKCLELAASEHQSRLREIYGIGRDRNESDILEIKALFDHYQIKEELNKQVELEIAKSKNLLEKMGPDNEYKTELINLTERLIQREI